MTPEELNELLAKTREQKFRKRTDNQLFAGVNISTSRKGQPSNHLGKQRPWKGKQSPFLGKNHSEETKEKISVSKQGTVSPLKGIPNGRTPHNKGIALSENTKEKIGKSLKGKVPHNKGQALPLELKSKISKIIVEKQGVKCYVIEPTGIRYDFDSIKECADKFNYKNLVANSNTVMPIDGTPTVGQRGKWKGWTFGRVV